MEHCSFSNTDLRVSTIGLGCYGMSGVYGPADDAESIATIRCALDLGENLLDTSASYGRSHNHRLIGKRSAAAGMSSSFIRRAAAHGAAALTPRAA
ncbi:MAG: aldo/keto reductase [Alphaproteobacteria bacterium]|nr:aldo/keto reductase [Alphaproteobacteria bacterium]